MKRLIMLLIVVGMLISAGGCTTGLAGSTMLKVTVITGMAGTAGAVALDKQLYEMLKQYDWFMIDPAEYMPELISAK